MFKCNRCKSSYDAEPSLENNAGLFCAKCSDHIKAASAAGRWRKPKQTDVGGERCVWCGECLTSENKARNDSSDHTCYPCDQNRTKWLRKCILYGDHAAKYVASLERREGPKREERKRLEVQRSNGHHGGPTTSAAASVDDWAARMERLEATLAKLARELGM